MDHVELVGLTCADEESHIYGIMCAFERVKAVSIRSSLWLLDTIAITDKEMVSTIVEASSWSPCGIVVHIAPQNWIVPIVSYLPCMQSP